MHGNFLTDLAIVLGVAGFTGSIAQRFKFPIILGYLLAGLIIGPYIPIPLFADTSRVEELAEFGVVFVMFCVGLEFQFKKLGQVIPTAGLTIIIATSMLFGSGYLVGQVLGWTFVESIFLGGSIAISSTMVVSKILESSPVTSAREHIFGVLILQDICAVVIVAALTAVSAGTGLSARELGVTLGELVGVLAIMIIGGYLTIPRLIIYVDKLNNKETLTIAACGVCFGMALLAESFGYSVALGAFVAGILVSESGLGKEIEHLLVGVKDIFASIFFVAIGMTVDPMLAFQNLHISILVAVAVIAGHFIFVSLAGLLSGLGLRKSTTSAIALGQIGEFSFIIASVGISAGVIKVPLLSILVNVAIITAFTTPFLFHKRNKIIDAIDRSIPNRIRLVFTFYETWLEKIHFYGDDEKKSLLRILFIIVADILITLLIAIVLSIFKDRIDVAFRSFGVKDYISVYIIAFCFVLITIPFSIGIVKNLLKFSTQLSIQIFRTENQTSSLLFRRILIGPVAALVAFPFFLFLSALFDSIVIIEIFAVLVIIGAIYFWNSVKNVEADVQSAARTLVSLISRDHIPPTSSLSETAITGLHEVVNFKIEENSSLHGKTLLDVNLRALTGSTVISIIRNGEDVILPTGKERLQVGDYLALAGTKKATSKAMDLLQSQNS